MPTYVNLVLENEIDNLALVIYIDDQIAMETK